MALKISKLRIIVPKKEKIFQQMEGNQNKGVNIVSLNYSTT